MKMGFLFQKGGLWIGAHYSTQNKRWCINLLPCCTIWIALEGGKVPHNNKKEKNKKCAATHATIC